MDTNESSQTFQLAIKNGDLATVERLIILGESCNSPNFVHSPLHIAILAGCPNMVSLLLNFGADNNSCQKENKITPLHVAAELNNDLVVMQLLAAPGVQVEAQMSNSLTALHIACGKGHCAVVKALLAGGANIEAITKTDRLTPLFFAVAMSHYDVFKILVDAGANVFAVSKSNCNVLHVAAVEGFCNEGVKALIRKSVNVNERNQIQVTPLHNATMMGNVEMVKIFQQSGADVDAQDLAGQTPLHRTTAACVNSVHGVLPTSDRARRTEIARLLIKHGAQVDMADAIGRTPLHLAVQNRELDLMLVLMDEGNADVNAIMTDGSPLLCCAVCPNANNMPGNCVAIVKALLKRGCDPNAIDSRGRSALHYAADICNFDMIKTLLAGGCYYNLGDKDNKSPVFFANKNSDGRALALLLMTDDFFMATLRNDRVIVKMCLQAWSDVVRCRSKRFKSPLNFPASKGFTKMVELLLEYGADTEAFNDDYASPIHYATRFNNFDVALALLTKGANFNARFHCRSGVWTALNCALARNNMDMICLIKTLIEMFHNTEFGHPRVVIRELKLEKARNPAFYQAIINALLMTKDYKGQNLLGVAQEHQREDIIAYLVGR